MSPPCALSVYNRYTCTAEGRFLKREKGKEGGECNKVMCVPAASSQWMIMAENVSVETLLAMK